MVTRSAAVGAGELAYPERGLKRPSPDFSAAAMTRDRRPSSSAPPAMRWGGRMGNTTAMVVVAPSGRGRHGDGATAWSGGRVGVRLTWTSAAPRGAAVVGRETAIACHLIGSRGDRSGLGGVCASGLGGAPNADTPPSRALGPAVKWPDGSPGAEVTTGYICRPRPSPS